MLYLCESVENGDQMDERKSGMSVNWSEILVSLEKNVQFLNKLIFTLETCKDMAENDLNFIYKIEYDSKIDESMRDLFVAKSRVLHFAKNKCKTGSMSKKWKNNKDEIALVVENACIKCTEICSDLVKKIKESNFSEYDEPI